MENLGTPDIGLLNSYPPAFEPQGDYSSHLPMLWYGLNITKGLVIELGSGDHSTKLLREYCEREGRPFLSFDSNKEWAEKTGSIYIADWDKDLQWLRECGLVFIDEAPGEHRKTSIDLFRDKAHCVVVHDTQESAEYVYKIKAATDKYKYRFHQTIGELPRTTILSNFIEF